MAESGLTFFGGSSGGGGEVSGSGLPSNVLTKTANFTAAAGDFILADATAGAFTITLPTDPADGALVTVKKIDASTNAVSVVPAASGTVEADTDVAIESPMFGAIFEHVGSDDWQIVAPTGVGVPAEEPIELFFFGVGDAPDLVTAAVAGTAGIDGRPGYYKVGGHVFLFGTVGILAAATDYADILSESLPFLPDLPAGYQMPDGLKQSDDSPNFSVLFTGGFTEVGQAYKTVRIYFYHDDPSYPDGWYFSPPTPTPTGTIAINLAGIRYPAA